MLRRNKIMAFIPSANLTRSRRFYETTLGMKVLYQDDFAIALESGGIMIRVTRVGKFIPYQFTVFGWEVVDIEASAKKLEAKKIALQHYDLPNQNDQGIWTAPGGEKVAWFLDSDGNVLSLTQFPTKSRKPKKS